MDVSSISINLYVCRGSSLDAGKSPPPKLHLDAPVTVDIGGFQDSLQVSLLDADIQTLEVLKCDDIIVIRLIDRCGK